VSVLPNIVWQRTASVEDRLTSAGVPAYVLDGDNLRHGLNSDLGFTAEDRRENVRRTAHVARDPKGLYARARLGEICSFTGLDAPYERPDHAEVVVTPATPVTTSVDAILAALRMQLG
jgi:bifunctional enzyme CysN/CysC